MAQQQNKKQGSGNICWAANMARWALPRLSEAEPSVLADLEDNTGQQCFPSQEIHWWGTWTEEGWGERGKGPGHRWNGYNENS